MIQYLLPNLAPFLVLLLSPHSLVTTIPLSILLSSACLHSIHVDIKHYLSSVFLSVMNSGSMMLWKWSLSRTSSGILLHRNVILVKFCVVKFKIVRGEDFECTPYKEMVHDWDCGELDILIWLLYNYTCTKTPHCTPERCTIIFFQLENKHKTERKKSPVDSIIHNCEKVKMPQMSIGGWSDQKIVESLYNRLLFSINKKWSADTWYNMNKS